MEDRERGDQLRKGQDQLKREHAEQELRRVEIALKEREIDRNNSLNEAKINEVGLCRNEEKEQLSVVYKAKLFRDALSKMPQDAVE